MSNFETALRAVKDVRVIASLIGVILVLVALYSYYLNPLKGFISVTVIDEAGAVRASDLELSKNSFQGIPYLGDQTAVAIAAVPSPTQDKYAFLTRSRGTATRLSIADPDGTDVVIVAEGEIEVPSWSPDGGSIAFSKNEGTEEIFSPDAWKVYRAVRNGDSLSIGNGYRPFPSPHQRTYALSSQGIVLLSYNDTEPTVVIQSPSPVPVTTPFAASHDARRLAWIAPWDSSLQVFEDVNGYLVPVLLLPATKANSLSFSPTGKHLMIATHNGVNTSLELISISSGRKKIVGEYAGIITLNSWRYEK